MATGTLPFRGESSGVIFKAILDEAPKSTLRMNPDLPADFERIINKCLEKDKKLRYQHASEIRADLQRLKRDEESSKVAAKERPFKTRIGLWRALWAIVAVIILVAGGVVVFRILRPPDSAATSIRSIAVLPFANASKDPDMEYLGDGLSEEVTNGLSRLSDIRVMAHSTMFHYKTRQDDPQGVGRDLKVDAVVTGRVREHRDDLDVEAELVDVATGAQLWGKRYKRSANDAAVLQAEVSQDIAAHIRPQLGSNERERVSRAGTKNPEAYQLYLKGRYHFARPTKEEFGRAVDCFNKAIALDPSYAEAHAGLADAYTLAGDAGWIAAPEALEKARTAAKRALSLDSQLPDAHTSLAAIELVSFGNYAEAESEIQKALLLGPSSAHAHEVSCWLNEVLARIKVAVTECEQAVELDPLSPFYNGHLGFAYFLDRDYPKAIEQANKMKDIDTNPGDALELTALAYQQMGNYKESIEAWAESQRHNGHEALALQLRDIFKKSGYRGFLEERATNSKRKGDYYDAACSYAMLGKNDAAFAALDKAEGVQRQYMLHYIKTHPELDNIRSDPRYANLLRKIGLPE